MHQPAVTPAGRILLDEEALRRTLSRIAHEIIEADPELDEVALVGIQTRGVPLARRLARLVEERAGVAPALGAVDITFYRDDVTVRGGEAPLAPQLLGKPGFQGYWVVDGGDGVVATISVYDSEEAAADSTAAAATGRASRASSDTR